MDIRDESCSAFSTHLYRNAPNCPVQPLLENCLRFLSSATIKFGAKELLSLIPESN